MNVRRILLVAQSFMFALLVASAANGQLQGNWVQLNPQSEPPGRQLFRNPGSMDPSRRHHFPTAGQNIRHAGLNPQSEPPGRNRVAAWTNSSSIPGHQVSRQAFRNQLNDANQSLANVRSKRQLAQSQFQHANQKNSQAINTMSQVAKSIHQQRSGIIRKLK